MSNDTFELTHMGKLTRIDPAPLLIFPAGTLSDEDKAELKLAGYVAIQHPDPASVLQLSGASQVLAMDDFMMAALSGLREDRTAMCKFVVQLHERAKAKEAREA